MCESFSEIVIDLEGPQRPLRWGGSVRETRVFAFCALFELKYCWIYTRLPNDNLEDERNKPGDSINIF